MSRGRDFGEKSRWLSATNGSVVLGAAALRGVGRKWEQFQTDGMGKQELGRAVRRSLLRLIVWRRKTIFLVCFRGAAGFGRLECWSKQ